MSDQSYSLKTVDRAFSLLRIVADAPAPLSLSDVATQAGINTSNAFRFLKTLEKSGHVVRDAQKRYSAIQGGGREIGLTRGIEIIDLIAASPSHEMSGSDLAACLSVDVPQVERALAKLSAASLVENDPETGHWRLSTGMMRFFRPLLNDQLLARFIRPVMQDLNKTFGETVSWFVPHGFEQVVVEVLPSTQPIRYVLETGARQPVYLGAAGKAHMASLDAEVAEEFLATLQPVQLTRFELDKPALLDELKRIRSRGYAISDSERVEGAVSVAIAVCDANQRPLGVISIMMPKFRTSATDMRVMGETLAARAAALFETGDPTLARLQEHTQ
ncbi:IclR family transcriptional regulator [Rhodobacter sp. NTK016B]|uniref:IclR family transcriptional regulator n=1 Tax=Rhodobacter sp. NTK016B TaxID=2759676 RepID=UPI001A8F5B27|nr:IclR family transcriptional regulator [Rhodobacter sp. NTK016B]MBN8291829.1 IclR family transcriptional regulator [Rhodobacter sp. NTK016B]